MSVLIFGNGQIGNFYLDYYRAKGTTAAVATGVDVTRAEHVDAAVASAKPSVVINAAGATNLEWCGANRLKAFEINVLGAANVARACDRYDVYLVHLSSGCIFSSRDGSDVRRESDKPDPSSYYGWTKAWSEDLVAFERSDSFRCLTLRPRQPVSSAVNHKNMLVKMLTFSKFVDTPNSGTVLEDLMEWTDALIALGMTGTFHVANSGWTTPYRIGLLLKELILPNLSVEKITKKELDELTPNTRVDTVLDITKLQSVGIEVAPYEARLRSVIERLRHNIQTTEPGLLREQFEKTALASRQRTVLNGAYQELWQARQTSVR